MSCEKMVKEILPFLGGRLREERRADIEKHLEACASCQLRTDEFRAVARLLDELPVIEPSPAFDIRVRSLVAGEPVKRSWWSSLRLSPRVALAASVLLIAVLWYGFYEHPSTSPTTFQATSPTFFWRWLRISPPSSESILLVCIFGAL